jgi:hypothetical protein
VEPTTVPGDDRLIDEAIAGIDAARARAPRDFLLAIAIVLGILAVALLAVGVLASGPVQDICLNLGSEVVGAWLTVVIIDGLWRRRDEGTSRSLEAMARRLEAHRGRPMTAGERDAWLVFVDESQALTARRTFPQRLRELRAYSGRLADLERQGNRTLSEFDPARADR